MKRVSRWKGYRLEGMEAYQPHLISMRHKVLAHVPAEAQQRMLDYGKHSSKIPKSEPG